MSWRTWFGITEDIPPMTNKGSRYDVEVTITYEVSSMGYPWTWHAAVTPPKNSRAKRMTGSSTSATKNAAIGAARYWAETKVKVMKGMDIEATVDSYSLS